MEKDEKMLIDLLREPILVKRVNVKPVDAGDDRISKNVNNSPSFTSSIFTLNRNIVIN